jgi:hypothetical protein
MGRSRYLFIVVIAAILAVLAIFAVIVLVEGDNEDQGDDTGPNPSPESAPLVTGVAGRDGPRGTTASFPEFVR